MSQNKAHPSSFRDPNGRIYDFNGKIFRTISRNGLQDFEHVAETGLLEELVADGQLVKWWQADDRDLDGFEIESAKVLEHERLDFVSYPYEWSFAGLKEAAIFHLGLQIKALEFGVSLSDATAYNVQFQGPHPVFIDHLSFRKYIDGEFWLGQKQFCEQFLNPLLLRAKFGIQHNNWFRGSLEGIPASAISALLPWRSKLSLDVLAHVVLPTMLERTATGFAGTSDLEVTKQAQFPKASYRKMLVKLKRWISALEPKGIKKTTWSDYASNHSYDDNEVRSKSAFVEDFTKSCQPGIVWDIGCNTGDYSKIALDAGAKLAIGFEYDSGALELAFRRAREQNLNFLPLYLDAANPSPNQGWNQTERLGFSGRRSADSVIALAVVHHLAIGRNIPLPDVVNWIVGCAPQGVIEFIPKSDPMIIRMLQNREDIFADYDEANFEYALTSRAQVIKTETISASGRKMYWYNR